jgi:hypothetical protein
VSDVAETTVERHVNSVGDAAVRARTGKGWEEWLGVLDALKSLLES